MSAGLLRASATSFGVSNAAQHGEPIVLQPRVRSAAVRPLAGSVAGRPLVGSVVVRPLVGSVAGRPLVGNAAGRPLVGNAAGNAIGESRGEPVRLVAAGPLVRAGPQAPG